MVLLCSVHLSETFIFFTPTATISRLVANLIGLSLPVLVRKDSGDVVREVLEAHLAFLNRLEGGLRQELIFQSLPVVLWLS